MHYGHRPFEPVFFCVYKHLQVKKKRRCAYGIANDYH